MSAGAMESLRVQRTIKTSAAKIKRRADLRPTKPKAKTWNGDTKYERAFNARLPPINS
jgi:hypothetical protein